MSDRPIPLSARRLDWVFIIGFCVFALTSFFPDRHAAMNADPTAGEGLLAEMMVGYGRDIDPLVAANPMWLRIMSGISAFVMGPFYLILVASFVKGWNRIRMPAIVYASAILYSLVVHVTMELIGPHPPANTPLLLLVYLPYAALPAALAWRMRSTKPFSAPRD
jgi:hypothetical protein